MVLGFIQEILRKSPSKLVKKSFKKKRKIKITKYIQNSPLFKRYAIKLLLKINNYSKVLNLHNNYSLSNTIHQFCYSAQLLKSLLSYLKPVKRGTDLSKTLNTLRLPALHTNFTNRYFFENEHFFFTKNLPLTGSSVPQNVYEVSHSLSWKTQVLEDTSKYYLGSESVVVSQPRRTSYKRRTAIRPKFFHHFQRSKWTRYGVKPYTLAKDYYQHTTSLPLRRKASRKRYRGLRAGVESRAIRNQRYRTSSKLLKLRARKKVQTLRSKLRKFNRRFQKGSPNRKWSPKSHLAEPALNYIKKFQFLGFWKSARISTKRFARKSYLFNASNKTKRLMNKIDTKKSSVVNSSLRWQNVSLRIDWHRLRTKRRLLRSQRHESEYFLTKDLSYWNHQRRFQNIKTQGFRKLRKRRLFRKFVNFRQRMYALKLRMSSHYARFRFLQFRSNPINMIIIAGQTKPKRSPKWKHNKPYLFSGDADLGEHNNSSLLDTYLHVNLQRYTHHSARAKKLQTYSHKQYSKSKSSKIKILPHLTKVLASTRNKNAVYSFRPSAFRITPKLTKPFRSSAKVYTHPASYLNRRRFKNRHKISNLFYKNSYTRRLKILHYRNCKSFNLKNTLVNTYLVNSLSSKGYINNLPSRVETKSLLKSQKQNSPIQRIRSRKLSHLPYLTLNNNFRFLSQSPTRQSISLCTRSSQHFTLKSPIMFLVQFFMKNASQSLIPKFLFKKKIFSFLKPNEVRQALMDRKKQIFTYKLVFNQKVLTKKNTTFSPLKLKQLYKSLSITGLRNHNSLFSNQSSSTNRVNNLNYQLSDVVNTDTFDLRGTDQLFKRLEVKIPRVRFKPGYQRLWRQSRVALKEALRVKFTYQQKLSQYITKFFRRSNFYAFSASEMSIDKVVIYSRLLPDLATLAIFLHHRLVYLNGRHIQSKSLIIYENDLIQLVVSKWYYAAYRWIANWTIKRVKKYKRLIYRKGLAGRYKLMKQRKQRSFYTPNWIYLTRYDISDIKPYLEVDYLTLSAILVYNPYVLEYRTPAETPHYRPTIYRLYNWKYIT